MSGVRTSRPSATAPLSLRALSHVSKTSPCPQTPGAPSVAILRQSHTPSLFTSRLSTMPSQLSSLPLHDSGAETQFGSAPPLEAPPRFTLRLADPPAPGDAAPA